MLKKGYRNIRSVVQMRCRSIRSVTKISRPSTNVVVEGTLWHGPLRNPEPGAHTGANSQSSAFSMLAVT